MNFLIAYLKSIGSEYQIMSSCDIVYRSENFENLEKCNEISNSIYCYNDRFYEKKIKEVECDGKYSIIMYDDVTKYAKEIIKSKTDFLTQLPNRTQIEKYLQKLNNDCVVVMSDIDDFKKVNDIYGHQVGDSIIKLIGNLIRSCIGNDNFAGRYGGEEFLIIFNTTDISKVKMIMDEFNVTLNKHTKEPKISVSTGIYYFCPRMERVESAIRKADEALYFVKHNGKNGSIIYDDIKKYGNR